MNIRYIDNHAHLNFRAFDADYKEAIKLAQEAGVAIINVGTQKDTSKRAVEIAEEAACFAIVGLHPVHTSKSFHDGKEMGEGGKEFTSRGEVFNREEYKKLLSNTKVVGIGECGLDYYHCTKESISKQKNAFIEQIKLANEFNKPLMLHIRNAYKDALEILKAYAKVKGNAHFFAGNLEDAKNFLNFGFTLSFTGVITFTHDYDEVIKNTPLNMIMSETDSPYVTPVPYRGKRNEPFYVKEVVKKIAEIKNLPEEEVAKAIIENTKRVFTL